MQLFPKCKEFEHFMTFQGVSFCQDISNILILYFYNLNILVINEEMTHPNKKCVLLLNLKYLEHVHTCQS